MAAFDRVREILVDELCLAPEEINPETQLVQDLRMDSVDAVDVALEIEDLFDITISDEVIEGWETVQDIVDTAEGRRA